jgi:putative heme-binding domain-containing protein
MLWLDASTLAEARRVRGLKPLREGDKLDAWPDGSGRGQPVGQPDTGAQPRYWPLGDLRLVRFDGVGSFLQSSRLGRGADNVTVFIVAAVHKNPGMFAGLFGTSATGKNDYQTGFNLDQGGQASTRLTRFNHEGAGMLGQANLLREPQEFGNLLRVSVASTAGPKGVQLFVNGKPQGARSRSASRIAMDEIIVGGRFYNNFAAASPCGFGEVDIAEVLIYDRVLREEERGKVDQYLATKYAQAGRIPGPAVAGKPLVRVTTPPPVQMMLPGFTVKQLPVTMPNVNNVLYRPDGKLVALGYNGNVYLLSDSDGDGLEDRVELYWEDKGALRSPIGLALTPPNYFAGEGVFVACKGKSCLLLDTNRDGKADKEVVIAQGWKELPHGVDALGVAVDPKDHSVYFGLGCMDYEDPYGVQKKGALRYSLTNERGSILRIAPDLKSREIVATGIRFPVGLRFNRHGDLFCTDQEGATWLPNGNPFDELLHIQKGRHYGFPPRHPQHLPNVIDEPSLMDYGPQHQSACGLAFNEPVNGGPTFGPEAWKDDVIVAGYSRGKLYRTQLIKTITGYVSRNQLLACLNMLTADACVSPRGDLVLAVHSGGPDWGNGPTGNGRLYQIRYTGNEVAQPVGVWAQTPREVRIAFDRPLTPEQVSSFRTGIAIEYGRYVAPGDRFEILHPGYQVVQHQQRTPRYALPIYSTQVTPDGRMLILATAVHPANQHYVVTLPDVTRLNGPSVLLQVPEMDIAYELTGVEASWQGASGNWSGWLPHLDPAIARQWTSGSAEHDRLWQAVQGRGRLTLRTTLQLRDMLRPAVQPGSRLEHTLPGERVTMRFASWVPFQVRMPGKVETSLALKRIQVVRVTTEVLERVPLEIVMEVNGDPALDITWHTAEDPRLRPLPVHRLLLPWAPASEESTPVNVVMERPELTGGNWERGRQVFLSEQGACSKCHSYRGEGQKIGPDLSNLPHRDYTSVLRDITEPSFAINPDFVTQVISLTDGRVLTGSVRTHGNSLLIANDKGEVTTVTRSDVEAMKPSKVSIMPEELPKQLGAERVRDLLTFLLTDPPRMPDYGRGKPPEPRLRQEVEAVLAGAPASPGKPKPIHLVLVAGRKDHGPGEHDYPAWQRVWKQLLSLAEGTTVSTANDWPSTEQLKSADVLVFYQQGQWTPERAKDLDAFFARGGGAVYLHYAVDGGKDAPGFAQRIGLAWQGGQSRYRHGWLDLGFDTGSRHPIGRNLDKLRLHDESYWRLVGDTRRVRLLASGKEDGEPQPLFWTLEPSGGRVFVSIPGHFSWTFDDPLFRVVLLRGMAWAAREPVDRFNALVYPGARVKEE